MNRAVVIANPVASQFTGGSHRDVMAQLTKTFEVEALWPQSAQGASEAAAHAAAERVEIVVAMGGDGMVHHVSQGLVGTGSALGIIPTGTTNVVARLLGIPSRPVRAARVIAHSIGPTKLGVAGMRLVRGTTASDQYAVFACGFGLDAEVVVRADSDPYRKYRFGSVHYARTALGVGLGSFPSRRPNLEVVAGGHRAAATTLLIQFREIYTYFGKVPLRLSEEPPDPMTALTLGRLHRYRIPQIVAGAVLGRDLGRVEEMEVWRSVDRVDLTATPPVVAQADGENLGMVDAASVRWMPDALDVIAG